MSTFVYKQPKHEPTSHHKQNLVVASSVDPGIQSAIVNLKGQIDALHHASVLESNNITDRHLADALDQIAVAAKQCRGMLNPT